MSDLSARRMLRRNQSVQTEREDFEHYPNTQYVFRAAFIKIRIFARKFSIIGSDHRFTILRKFIACETGWRVLFRHTVGGDNIPEKSGTDSH